MYAGLYDLVVEFAQQRGYTVAPVFSNYFGWPGKVEHEDIGGKLYRAVDEWNLVAGGNKISPHDFQLQAIIDGLCDRRRVILLPTGAGKSLVIYILIRMLILYEMVPHDQHIVLVVPTVNLVKQMYSDFEDYSSLNGWDVEDVCQTIYAGQEKHITKKVVITTWQSLIKFPLIFFKKIGAIFGDEAHHFTADSLTKIMNLAVNAPYRIATTATLQDEKINKLTLQGLFGQIKRYVTTKDLQDRGILAPLSIGVMVLKYSEDICKTYSKVDYKDEINFITNNPIRDAFTVNLALGMPGNTLVMFKLVEHGKRLYEDIKRKTNRPVYLIYGGVGADEREEIRKILNREKNAIAVVSVGTFAEGVNIKNINNLINAAPGKSRIKTLQAIGRTLRLSEDGTPSMLVDIADNFCFRTRKNHTFRHLEERIKMYNEEQFEYSICEVKI